MNYTLDFKRMDQSDQNIRFLLPTFVRDSRPGQCTKIGGYGPTNGSGHLKILQLNEHPTSLPVTELFAIGLNRRYSYLYDVRGNTDA
jgi:hypothetical protein